jgi:hypothetical protein
MSLRKKIFVSASVGIAILAFFVSCSNLNDSNNVGDEILSDPNQTSFDKNFLAFSGDSTQVLKSFSIPNGSSDQSFCVHSGMLAIGGKGFDSATGYVKFLIDTILEKNFKPGDSLLSITIQFDTVVLKAEKPNPARIRIQSCSDDSALVRKTPDSSAVYSSILRKAKKENSSDSVLIDTLTGTIRDSIFKACTSYTNRVVKCDTNTQCIKNEQEPLIAAFSLFNEDSWLYRLKNPVVTIRYTRRNTTKNPVRVDTSSQTIKPYYYNYIAYESAKSIDSLSAVPLSSYSSRLTAAFKIDLQPLWNKIDNSKQANFNEILSAGFIIKGESEFPDSAAKSDSTVEYGYFFSPTLITDGNVLHDSLFGKGRMGSSKSGDTIVMSVDDLLRPLIRSEHPASGYFYIGITSSSDLWKRVIWGKPIFKAVATTLKR